MDATSMPETALSLNWIHWDNFDTCYGRICGHGELLRLKHAMPNTKQPLERKIRRILIPDCCVKMSRGKGIDRADFPPEVLRLWNYFNGIYDGCAACVICKGLHQEIIQDDALSRVRDAVDVEALRTGWKEISSAAGGVNHSWTLSMPSRQCKFTPCRSFMNAAEICRPCVCIMRVHFINVLHTDVFYLRLKHAGLKYIPSTFCTHTILL